MSTHSLKRSYSQSSMASSCNNLAGPFVSGTATPSTPSPELTESGGYGSRSGTWPLRRRHGHHRAGSAELGSQLNLWEMTVRLWSCVYCICILLIFVLNLCEMKMRLTALHTCTRTSHRHLHMPAESGPSAAALQRPYPPLRLRPRPPPIATRWAAGRLISDRHWTAASSLSLSARPPCQTAPQRENSSIPEPQQNQSQNQSQTAAGEVHTPAPTP